MCGFGFLATDPNITKLASSFLQIVFDVVPREANVVADSLAKSVLRARTVIHILVLMNYPLTITKKEEERSRKQY